MCVIFSSAVSIESSRPAWISFVQRCNTLDVAISFHGHHISFDARLVKCKHIASLKCQGQMLWLPGGIAGLSQIKNLNAIISLCRKAQNNTSRWNNCYQNLLCNELLSPMTISFQNLSPFYKVPDRLEITRSEECFLRCFLFYNKHDR